MTLKEEYIFFMANKDTKNDYISVYWNYSHIWGLLVWHSLSSLSIPFRIITAKDILEEGIQSKLLLVPGGNARHKSRDLYVNGKPVGHDIIRNFVKDGGNYLGFCGGAGFALSEKESLSICPWKRSAIQARILHHISGHLHVDCAENKFFTPRSAYQDDKIFPVWFPARFEAVESDNNPTILARYTKPSADLFMSDLPLAAFPTEILQESVDLYGANLDPLLTNEPSTIMGNYGDGQYLLSYAHLETPNSPFANSVYFNILEEFSSIQKIRAPFVPELELDNYPIYWEDKDLEEIKNKVLSLFSLGLELQLFYARKAWLYGWKDGMQGVQLTSLRTVLCLLQSLKPNEAMLKEWQNQKEEFINIFNIFYKGAVSWLYARRLCQSLPESVSPPLLSDQQSRLFGKNMGIDGICNSLIQILEKIFILQDDRY